MLATYYVLTTNTFNKQYHDIKGMKVLLQRSKLSQLVHVLLSSPLLAVSNINIHVNTKIREHDLLMGKH
jgi:hypothetical protein